MLTSTVTIQDLQIINLPELAAQAGMSTMWYNLTEPPLGSAPVMGSSGGSARLGAVGGRGGSLGI